MMAWLQRRYRWFMLLVVTLGLCWGLGQGHLQQLSTAQAQGNSPPPTLAPALPMINGNFEDSQKRFQIGIFDGYQVSRAGNSPLIQSPDGSLAYTVAITPLATGTQAASEADLTQAAQQAFGRGEGFKTGDVQAIPGGGIRINWTGQLSQGGAKPQPMSGKIFARQRGSEAFLLMVAATSEAEPQVADAIITLGSTLTVP